MYDLKIAPYAGGFPFGRTMSDASINAQSHLVKMYLCLKYLSGLIRCLIFTFRRVFGRIVAWGNSSAD